MDVDIHCNVIKCRRKLSVEGQACVTSCSHIFCLDCAKRSFDKALVCPACKTNLVEENDDMILVQMNPTEEYKSSVLAGLKPDNILDICTRAIAFYEYQTSQELSFQSLLQKNLQDKYKSLKIEKEKHQDLVNECESEKSKSQQLYQQLQEKSKQFQKLQSVYEKLKRKHIGNNLQETFTTPPAAAPVRPMMTRQFNKSDIVPHRSNASTTRIPSPVKSIYSVRSHHRRFYSSADSTTSNRVP
ncbi:hypothetical protein INT48_002961 [Thamnidium elegans]|uniref:RING-type domain-containing protein n=1 Tax=Thamnidium elegans TaxID=101142 RepID=A0A8H7VPV8_9FUNG|nr:hypothetical protein INT48_002961 [Thamnidium elegans]